MENFYKIDVKELKNLRKRLKNNLITGYDPLNKNNAIFKTSNNYEIIAETAENLYSRFGNTVNVTKNKGQQNFYLLHYGCYALTDMPDEIIFHQGFSVNTSISKEEYWNNCSKYDINLSGEAYCCFDDSFTWCIFQADEFMIMTGDELFVKSYYTEEKQKLKEIEMFIEEAQDPDFIAYAQNTINYLKYKKNGKWIIPK